MWVLLKINFDTSWSVIEKCIKGPPLVNTHFACKNIFTNQLTELLLILDVEQNPGREKEKSHVTFCHWNLHGLMAFIKVSLLQTLAVTSDYDITCLYETFLDSSFENDDDRIFIPGYHLFCADHPSNTKRGGACIYYMLI